MHRINEFIEVVKKEQYYISDTCTENVEINWMTNEALDDFIFV